MKKFIKKLVADVKFSDAGQGHRLDEAPAPRPSSARARPAIRAEPSQDAQTAGSAALARSDNKMSASMKQQKMEMRRQMQREAAQGSATATQAPHEPEVITQQQLGLRMLCPVCNGSFSKPHMAQHYENCLEQKLEEAPLQTTCTMIHTLNSGQILENGIKTLSFFVENIIKSPDEEKYRKIRVNNAGVQKKVIPLVAGVEFLEIVGFTKIKDDSDGEDYFILLEVPELDYLTTCVETLRSATKLTPTLDRDVRVLQASVGTQKFEVSQDFYRVTKEDLMTEQKRKAEENAKSSLLRTQSMRDRDSGVGMRIYHYTVIRVRFPDGLFLQGTFSAHDTVESLFKFVEGSLRHPLQFSLITPGCPPLKRDNKSMLKAAGLVPAATLNLSTPDKSDFTLLSDELICKL